VGFIRPPGTVVRGSLIRFTAVSSFFKREISDVPQPIARKFCHMLGSVFNLIIPVQKFGDLLSPSQKWGMGQKHAKFGAISDDFRL